MSRELARTHRPARTPATSGSGGAADVLSRVSPRDCTPTQLGRHSPGERPALKERELALGREWRAPAYRRRQMFGPCRRLTHAVERSRLRRADIVLDAAGDRVGAGDPLPAEPARYAHDPTMLQSRKGVGDGLAAVAGGAPHGVIGGVTPPRRAVVEDVE